MVINILQIALPPLTQPLSGLVTPGTGYWLDIIVYYVKDVAIVVASVLAMAYLLWIGWGMLANVNAARTGKNSWGSMVLSATTALAILGFMAYLLHEVVTII